MRSSSESFFSKCDQICCFSADLVTFTDKTLNGKLHFSCSVHIVKRVRIRSYSGLHFSRIFLHSNWIQRDSLYLSVFSPNAEKCEKNADQNNSEYGLFLRSGLYLIWKHSLEKSIVYCYICIAIFLRCRIF